MTILSESLWIPANERLATQRSDRGGGVRRSGTAEVAPCRVVRITVERAEGGEVGAVSAGNPAVGLVAQGEVTSQSAGGQWVQPSSCGVCSDTTGKAAPLGAGIGKP